MTMEGVEPIHIQRQKERSRLLNECLVGVIEIGDFSPHFAIVYIEHGILGNFTVAPFFNVMFEVLALEKLLKTFPQRKVHKLL